MKRRDLISLLTAAAIAPKTAFGQPKQGVFVIGFIGAGSRASSGDLLAAFKDALISLGWKEGSQFVIEERWAEGLRDQTQALAEQLKPSRPAVVLVNSQTVAGAASKALPQTPIIMASGSDPVAAGLAKSLARPGGMVTGTTNVLTDLTGKNVELLLAVAPKVKRIGLLSDPSTTNQRLIVESARRSLASLPVEPLFEEATTFEQINAAVARLAKNGAQALILLSSASFGVFRQHIAKEAIAHRWPLVAVSATFAEAGALICYGSDRAAGYRRAAYYVDKILKGAKPGDLPIEQPTEFELIINLKTAKGLGIRIPQSLLLRATKIIE